MILLNPGPVNLSENVRNSFLGPDLCHREPEFIQLQAKIRSDLLAVYDTDPDRWATILLAGSGTAAVEAMLTSFISDNGMVLVVENGVYGERMSNLAEIYKIPFKKIHFPWGASIDHAEVERVLAENSQLTHCAMVHHETTTGRLNDLSGIGSLCLERNVDFLVDTVSSFGAEEIAFEEWGITACAGCANKCLHGAPGLAFGIAKREALSLGQPPRSLYLDLNNHCIQQDKKNTAFTQPVHLYYVLEKALEEFFQEGGWKARHSHYESLANQVREGLLQLGIHSLIQKEQSSVVLNSYTLPTAIEYQKLHGGLKEKGFVIYAGQGKFNSEIFRISTMGAITTDDISRLLEAFKSILATHQGSSNLGSK